MPRLWQTTYKFSNDSSKTDTTTNHSHLSSKSGDNFKGLLESQNRAKLFSKVTVSEKVHEASYLVAEINAQKMKSHTVGEKLII